MSDNNLKIQNKLETSEGYIVKIKRKEADSTQEDKIYMEGLFENPTDNLLKYSPQMEIGVLYKYVDEYDLDKNSQWSRKTSTIVQMKPGGGIEPRYSAPFSLDALPKSTSEITPYMILNGNIYPPCFTDDPRYQCYQLKYVKGEGFIKEPRIGAKSVASESETLSVDPPSTNYLSVDPPSYAYNTHMLLRAYEFAIQQPVVLEQITDYSTNSNLRASYINDDGTFNEYATSSDITNQQTLYVKNLFDSGMPIQEIKAKLETKYGT